MSSETRGLALVLVVAACRPQPAAPRPDPVMAPPTTPAQREPEPTVPPSSDDDPGAPSVPEGPRVTVAPGAIQTVDGQYHLAWEALQIERLEPDPSDPDDAGGDLAMLSLTVAGRRCTLQVAPDPAATAPCWAGEYRVHLVALEGSPSPSAQIVLLRVSDEAAAEPREVRLQAGDVIELSAGVQMRFDGHSHKRTSPGQRSPLMVDVEYTSPGTKPEYRSPHLLPPEETTWTWREFVFESLDYAYDDWVRLKITPRRLVAADVTP